MMPAPPECPVTLEERDWLESRMDWLGEKFGKDRMIWATLVLPNDEFFPHPYEGTPEDARVLLDSLCEYVGVAPETVELYVVDDRSPAEDEGHGSGAARFREPRRSKYCVEVEDANLDDPLVLIATMAHELARALLIEAGGEKKEREPLADLLTVFLGLGVLTGNIALREKYYDEAYTAHWQISRRGYLSMAMYGYALALFARVRVEMDPPWISDLRPDVRDACIKGLAYLEASNQTLDTTNALEQQPSFPIQGGLPPSDTFDEPSAEAIEEEKWVCSFCGVQMAPGGTSQHPKICAECQDSIDENHQELIDERYDEPARTRMAHNLLLWGLLFCVIILLLFLIGSVVKWFEV
jgi:hypothetical protein